MVIVCMRNNHVINLIKIEPTCLKVINKIVAWIDNDTTIRKFNKVNLPPLLTRFAPDIIGVYEFQRP